jgi:mono/diheme cytochrome c family protein
MRKVWTWGLRILGGLVGLALIAWIVVWGLSEAIVARTYTATAETVRAATSPEQVIIGKRLAAVFGCSDCHGPALQGKLFFDEPNVARVHTPSLTRAAQRFSDTQLAQSIRQGIRPDGRALFAMPSEMYVHLRDDELAAVLGYLRSLPVGGEPMPPIEWRILGRVALVAGELGSAPPRVAKAKSKLPLDAAERAKGRHTALTACSECHGPDLGGLPGPVGLPDTPDLAIAAAYDIDAFRRLMWTGVARGDRELGLMSAVARSRFSHLTDDEVDQLHAYLKARAEALQRHDAAK